MALSTRPQDATGEDAVIVIGIDPGITGAMAVISALGGSVMVEDLPTSPRGKTGRRQIDAVALARKFDSVPAAAAYVEHAHASPQMGVSGAFGYGETFGMILGVIATHGFAVHLVRPRRWRQELGLRKGAG